MLKKILSMFLAVIVLTVASGASAAAQTGNINENPAISKRETEAEVNDLKSLIKNQDSARDLTISNKSTLAEYERQKRQGKGLSTTTKVLIGVGIAAAVVGIVVFAASRDKIRTF
ncbi:MAG TPA: hypothetical protein VIL74_12260 [Pyrinomonadaceae bacterium]|jgi:CHASE3 domain sensor protein